MSKENLFRNYYQIITAVDNCIAENLIMPALVLVYSAIDSVSWLASENENQQVGERFQSWVDIWMLQKYPLPCTAEELYAARCGILHTLTPNSKLSAKKGVRQISYAWGTANQKDLDESLKLLDFQEYVAVHVNDIISSFKNGFADFIEDAQADKVKKELFIQKSGKHFVNTEISVVSNFLASAKEGGG